MKSIWYLLVLLFDFSAFAEAPISIVSWNIRDLGKRKSTAEIEYISKILKDYDVVVLQEVVAGLGGAKACRINRR